MSNAPIDNWSETRQRDLREAALAYAVDLGWPVIPLHAPTQGGCTCNKACKSPGKHPRTPHGLHDASTDPEQIERWWNQWPAANIGLRTGVAFDVIDVDSPEAEEALHAARQGDWIYGPKVKTPRGRHLYVAVTGLGNVDPQLPGVDFRGKGGYVVAPPSSHYSGRAYVWGPSMANSPLLAPPDWFMQLLEKPAPAIAPKPVPARVSDAYARKALEGEVQAVLDAPPGSRNKTLNYAAWRMGRLVGAGALDRTVAYDALVAAGMAVGQTEREARGTTDSGLTKGALQPRERSL